MKKTATRLFFVLFLCCAPFAKAEVTSVVSQSAREVPVAYEIDLLLVGGSTGAVAAACEASRAGAKVLLVTPYPYLGEDRTATLRLWPEPGEDSDDPLAKRIMDDPHRDPMQNPNLSKLIDLATGEDRIPYTYEILEPVDASHGEIDAPGRLGDGKFFNPVTESLQVNGNATVVVDLGNVRPFAQAMLLGFQRETGYKPFKIEQVRLSLSDDGKNWKSVEEPLRIENRCDDIGQDNDSVLPFTFRSETPVKSRYLKFEVQKSADSKRVMLAELIVLPKTVDMHENVTEKTDENILRCPRPMHVKHVLDQELLDAGVPFLFNTFVDHDVDVRDASGNLRGVIISNRAGRQAVIAKKILHTRSKPTSLAKAQFVVIGGEPLTPDLSRFPLLKSVSSETVGAPFVSLTRQILGQWGSAPANDAYPVINYTFEVAVPEGTAVDDIGFRQKLENQIRLATFDPKQAFTADEIYFGEPLKAISAWRTQGKESAKEALAVQAPLPESLQVVSKRKGGRTLPGDVGEILSGIRSGLETINESAPKIRDPKRDVPVLAEYDVVVVGGGTSGAPAGIAAGRHGAKTLVLEHLHDLGGIGTAGAISIYWYGNRVGFTKEVQAGQAHWSIEDKIHWWRQKLAEAGSDIWCGVMVTGAYVDGNRVKGVLVSTPQGTGIVTAKFVIDATGNADVAAAAGVETLFVNDREIAVQGAGLAPRNLGASYTNTDYMFVDETDIVDTSHVFVYAKEKFNTAFDLGKLLSTRERRQIVGDFSFNVVDQINRRTYPDSIVYAYSDYDTHGYTVDPYMELNHPYNYKKDPDKPHDRTDRLYAYVPYRSSIPKDFDGLLVAGLATSCHRDALPIIRMQPDLQNQGYALGTATAMMISDGISETRKLDVRKLQKHLVETGNLEPAVASHSDNYGRTRDRLPGTVDNLPEHFEESAPLVMWYPEDAKPLLRKAYLKETDFERKLVYAKTAAALGDPVGAETLLKKLESYDKWDRGWDFKAMGQAGSATSAVDKLIMMIGWTKDPRAVGPIAEKMKLLDAKSSFSHHRAVILALENIGGPEAAAALAEHLAKPDMTGYVHDTVEKAKLFDKQAGLRDWNQEKARRDSLIEISLARALYRCGDVDGKGEAILRHYLKDLRGYFARHANEVLKGERTPEKR